MNTTALLPDRETTASGAVDNDFLQTMVGYNARMAALAVIGEILPGWPHSACALSIFRYFR